MTTKFLDNKIKHLHFQSFIVVAFPTKKRKKKKNSDFDDFPLCPQGPPIKKRTFYFIVFSGEKLKYHPFWAPPFSIKHPQDNSSLQNAN